MTENSNLIDNIKLCECGCGEPTNIYKGRYSRFLHSHNLKTINHSGEKHWNWNGGRTKLNGYWYIYKPDHPFANNSGYYAEHRWIYEQHYNCCLLPWIDIHHKNGKRDDNRIENLQELKICQVDSVIYAVLQNIIQEIGFMILTGFYVVFAIIL
jgi:hypothetical protein